MTLNYKGSDTYKTIGGAFISLSNKVWSFAVFFVMAQVMIQKRGWSMTDQIEILDSDELQEAVKFDDYPRFKLGMEISQKYMMYDKESYINNATLIKKLTYVNEQTFLYSDYYIDNINDKWNNSPLSTKMAGRPAGSAHSKPGVINKQGFLEYQIDLNGTLLQGS